MAILPVRQIGDPVLRAPAAAVDDPKAVTGLAADMYDTLRATRASTSYGRAIAAPQVGSSVRVVVAERDGAWTLVNPQIIAASEERVEWWDACLSFLDTFGTLTRHRTVTVRWQDLEGATQEERFDDEMAELLQHELDHLDGVLCIDRFADTATICNRRRFEREHRRSSPYGAAGSGGPDPLRISLASLEIDPVFLHSPAVVSGSLGEELGMTVVAKVETVNPIRSFKGRGTDWLLRTTEDHAPVVCASAGNFGQGLAYAAGARGIPCTVFAPENANELKVERMRALGAEVRLTGQDFDASKEAARRHAAEGGARFVEDGAETAVAEGAGTIAAELGEHPALLDAVLVPVGNGALINGIGAWIKAFAPHTSVVGVCAAGAPSMAESWRAGQPRPTSDARTIADGIAVREPVPEAVESMRSLVDDMLLVEDPDLIAAMRLAHRHLGVVVEPAGAAGLAAAIRHRDRWAGSIVGVPLAGGNLTPAQIARWLGA